MSADAGGVPEGHKKCEIYSFSRILLGKIAVTCKEGQIRKPPTPEVRDKDVTTEGLHAFPRTLSAMSTRNICTESKLRQR